MPRPRRGGGRWWLLVLLVVAGAFAYREYRRIVREEPERLPWTPLSLADPIGPFTGRKLAGLGDDTARCEALLGAIGDADRSAPSLNGPDPACGYDDGLSLRPDDRTSIRYVPAGLVTACPVAAALVLWERDVVQPAALRLLGQRVTNVDHFGSYSCRRLYGRSEGPWSEHASADAVDIAGFRLADGRQISVLRDWTGESHDAAFLRVVRDGACRLFATVLSPDYNAAHANHLHLDQAQRGAMGWRGCR